MHSLIKYTIQFKSYEHLHLNISTSRADARRSLVTVLQTSGQTILKCINKQ